MNRPLDQQASRGSESQPGDAARCLTAALPGWGSAKAAKKTRYLVGVLRGEGVGPEVTSAAVDVLKSVGRHWGLDMEFRYGGAIGCEAGAEGNGLPLDVIRFCESIFADGGTILCGPGGKRFVYELRTTFELFCKFTPICPFPELADVGVLRPEAVDGVDLVVVRENTGGVYFGKWNAETSNAKITSATHSFQYDQDEVTRILEVAVGLSRQRSRRITLVVKPGGVPTISRLWTEVFEGLTSKEDLSARVLEVDHACYEVIASAGKFDVLVAPNMIGDIISDGAALLLGSRGLSFSGNFGAPGVAVYQTGHGAARDIAGRDIANPIGQILSAAMLLAESFQLPDAAASVRLAIARTISSGFRTADIATANSTVLGTRAMGQEIAAAVEYLLPEQAVAS